MKLRIRNYTICFALSLAMFAVGCGDSDDTTPVTENANSGGGGGKTDAANNGGTSRGTPVECSFNDPWLLESSEELDNISGETQRFTPDDIGTISELRKAQILTLVAHTSVEEFAVDLEAAFGASDDDDFALTDIEIDGAEFDWYTFFAGDTEVGAVFEADTLTIVAEISDGDILNCTVAGAPDLNNASSNNGGGGVDPVECSFSEPWLLESSSDLDDISGESEEFTLDNIDGISELHKSQILAAVAHTSFEGFAENIEAAFGATDDDIFTRTDIEIGGAEFDWYTFFSGDTEVGAVFDKNTTDIVAEISDGDILNCTSVPTDLNNASSNNGGGGVNPVECSFSESWLLESSSDLDDISGESERFTPDDIGSISELRKAQILTLVAHTSVEEFAESIEAAFGASDDDDFVRTDIEIDGAEFDWYTFFAGDTEVGAVFDKNTTDIVAEISDGDILSCQ